MDYEALAAELTNDPIGRNYAAMADEDVVISLNTEDRTRIKSWVTGYDVFRATDPTEFESKTEVQRREWMMLCAIDQLDPDNNGIMVALAQSIFDIPANSPTVQALIVLRTETITRFQELGFGFKAVLGDVQNARNL